MMDIMIKDLAVRSIGYEDISRVAAIHKEAFSRQFNSEQWIRSNIAAFPETLGYVAMGESGIEGYIFWQQVSGFREKAVLDLKQIAVSPRMQGQGIGRMLIRQTFPEVKNELDLQGSRLHCLLVKTALDNQARRLYIDELGVKPVAQIEGMFRSPEVYLMRAFDD